jgi:hypothetical protein
MRAHDLITTGMLPALLAPPVALADETLPTASEIDAAIHGAFNNGEDVTRPRNLITSGCPTLRDGSRRSG